MTTGSPSQLKELSRAAAPALMLEREAEMAALAATLDAARAGEGRLVLVEGSAGIGKPTLLVVDDLHWADEPSLRWLVYLARRLEGLPLLLLIGTRPPAQANTPAATLVAELLADPSGVVIHPGSLGQESAATLARERL